jgi:hypothetical protein
MIATGEDVTSLWLVQMRRYPAPIALRVSVDVHGRVRSRLGNGYRRTGTLRKSWMRIAPRVEGNTVIAEVRSSGQIAPYNVYVQMEGVQAWMHTGRWLTEVQVIEQTRGQVANRWRADGRNGAGSNHIDARPMQIAWAFSFCTFCSYPSARVENNVLTPTGGINGESEQWQTKQ